MVGWTLVMTGIMLTGVVVVFKWKQRQAGHLASWQQARAGEPRQGEAARAQAEGEADALRTKGEAEATYNAKVAASLTPVLIQQQYLLRWNGQLPQYSLGGDHGVFLQLPGGIQK